MTLRQVADCPCLPQYHCAKFGDSISNGGRVIAIFGFSKWRPAAILDLAQPMDHPRWQLDGLKCPVKFRIDLIRIDLTYCFEDIKNSIVLTFGLK